MSTASNSILNLPSVYNVEVAAFHRTLHYICDRHEINVLSQKARPIILGGQLPPRKIDFAELSLCIFSIHELPRRKLAKHEIGVCNSDQTLEINIGVVSVLYLLMQLAGIEPIKALRYQGILAGQWEQAMLHDLIRSVENISSNEELIEHVSEPVRIRFSKLLTPRRERENGTVADRFIIELFNLLDIRTFESFVCIFRSRNLSIAEIAEKYARKYNNQQGERKVNFNVTPLEWTCAMVVALRLPIGDINIRDALDLSGLDTARIDHKKDYTIRNFAFASAEHNRVDQQKNNLKRQELA